MERCFGWYMSRMLATGILCASMLSALPTFGFADGTCSKIVMTGHPDYPVIAYRDGDAIIGAAPALVTAIGKQLNVPVESKFMGSWQAAQKAARDGKADMIVGVYYNDARAAYLDYVEPAFIFDQTVVFARSDKTFAYTGQADLIGKKGVTNEGESFGSKFDAFLKDKLDVTRVDGLDAAFKDLLDGKADYVIAGYYPGIAELAKQRMDDKIEPLSPVLVNAEMFLAFSKKSPCAKLASQFGAEVAKMTTDGRFDAMLMKARSDWNAANNK